MISFFRPAPVGVVMLPREGVLPPSTLPQGPIPAPSINWNLVGFGVLGLGVVAYLATRPKEADEPPVNVNVNVPAGNDKT